MMKVAGHLLLCSATITGGLSRGLSPSMKFDVDVVAWNHIVTQRFYGLSMVTMIFGMTNIITVLSSVRSK